MRRHLVFLLLVVLALSVRLPHLGHGLPLVLEEALPAKKAFDMWGWQEGALQLDPGTVGWPAFSFYANLASQKLVYLAGRATGAYANPLDFFVAHELDPSTVILAGRWLGVLAAVLTVLVACRLARRLTGDLGAVAAGLALALSPLLVRHAQLVTPDILLVLFAALATDRIVRLAGRSTWRDYVWAGVWIGLGAACKYTPVLLLAPLLVVHLLRSHHEGTGPGRALLRDARPWAAGLVALAVLLLTSPNLVSDLAVLRRDVGYQVTHMGHGHFGQEGRAANWLYYLRDVLLPGLGYAAAVIGAVGLGWVAWRRRGPWLALLLCLLPFYPGLAFMRTGFDRYMLPALLPLAVGTAAAVDLVRERLAGRSPATVRAVTVGLVVLIASGGAVGTVRYHLEMARPATSQLLARWLEDRYDGHPPYLALEHYTVELPDTELNRNPEVAPVLARLSPAQVRRLQDRVLYDTVLLPLYSTFPEHSAPYYDLRWLRPYDLIVTSSAVRGRYAADPERFAAQNRFYRNLERYGRVVARFDAAADGARGPTLTVYRLDDAAWQRVERELGPPPRRWNYADTSLRHFQPFMGALARHAFQKDLYDEAATYYGLLVESMTDEDAEGLARRRGFIEVQRGEFAAARRLFEQVLATEPDDPAALLGLAVVLDEQGDRARAADLYRRVIAVEPGGTNAELARRRLGALGGG